MDHNHKQLSSCENGAAFWRDNAQSRGESKAADICRQYLEMNLKCQHCSDERQFCREIFKEIFVWTAAKVDPAKLVYPYDFETADERLETSYYHKNRMFNGDCARGIDELINDSYYKTYHYNLEIAAMIAILRYGFERVNLVLAFNIQKQSYDLRFSPSNREWAGGFFMPEKAFTDSWLKSHATLIDSFTGFVRRFYTDLDAELFSLPGHVEQGEVAAGYHIIRAIMIDDNQGCAIGHNPDAVSPYVCWQFMIRDGERHYNWGDYGEEQTARDSYIARVFVALNK